MLKFRTLTLTLALLALVALALPGASFAAGPEAAPADKASQAGTELPSSIAHIFDQTEPNMSVAARDTGAYGCGRTCRQMHASCSARCGGLTWAACELTCELRHAACDLTCDILY